MAHDEVWHDCDSLVGSGKSLTTYHWNRPQNVPAWSDEQDNLLCNLVKKNLINYTNFKPNYLLKVIQERFPNFIGTGASTHSAAVHCLHKKIKLLLSEEFAMNGGRLSGELEVRI
jgi:hypothetical protein